jgi:membrane fusion protein, multidrug efflux system
MHVLRWRCSGWAIAIALLFLSWTPSAAGPAKADKSPEVIVRGVVKAEAVATISTELVARIESIPFRVGQSFRADDVILTFDCRRYQADLRAAEAEVRTQAITVATHRQLLRHNATGSNDLALAEAKHAQSAATAESLKLRISQCAIRAPYDGRVVERAADIFEMPQANAPLMKIVKTGRLELDLIVPSDWAVWLEPGHIFRVDIDETRTKHDARLLNLGAVVDPVSRTMKLTAELVNPSPLIRPGMSGSTRFLPPIEVRR